MLPAMAAAAAIAAVLLLVCRCTAPGDLRVAASISASATTADLASVNVKVPLGVACCWCMSRNVLLHDQGFLASVTCCKTQHDELRHPYVRINSVISQLHTNPVALLAHCLSVLMQAQHLCQTRASPVRHAHSVKRLYLKGSVATPQSFTIRTSGQELRSMHQQQQQDRCVVQLLLQHT
jgi:hypothetical protein